MIFLYEGVIMGLQKLFVQIKKNKIIIMFSQMPLRREISELTMLRSDRSIRYHSLGTQQKNPRSTITSKISHAHNQSNK